MIHKIIRSRLLLLLLAFCTVSPVAGATNNDSTRVFTPEHPLVYEDAWDLWPYAFLNENGEPVGYNIDLLRIIFKELNIPYVIKLKPTEDALTDLKNGRADLMCGMEAHFHNEYAKYGKSVIQMFTHSVVHREDDPLLIKKLDDLKDHRVIVHEGSFSHHLMKQKGWGANAIPYKDMQDAVHFVHNEPGYQIVWNTLSLKWLIHKLHYKDLELTPVNIPHGKYKFMSNNAQLLHLLDSVYTQLNSTNALQPIQNKWFYPERHDTGIPSWIWKVVIVLLLLTLAIMGYYLFHRNYEHRVTKDIRRRNARLSQILKTCGVRLWQFDVARRTVKRYVEGGLIEAGEMSFSAFFNLVIPEDRNRIHDALQQVLDDKQRSVALDVQVERDGILTDFIIGFSVLRRDKNGRPAYIIGTSTDVTAEHQRQQHAKDTMLRYQYIFESAMVDTVAYDEHGIITNMNSKARQAFPKGIGSVLSSSISVQDVLGMDDVNGDNLEYTYLTQLYRSPDDPRALNRYLKRDEMCYELQLVPIRDDNGLLLGVYGTGRDVTEVARLYRQVQQNILQLQQANEEMSSYIRNIDYVLKNGGVRMVYYSPDTHMLTVYESIDRVQNELTQMRALSLIADSSQRVAQRLFNSMDNHTLSPVKAAIETVLRVKGGKKLFLYLSFIPIQNAKGELTGYFGMFRDISEIKATEQELARETARAQEVETVKNAFLHNMSYEIRMPLNSVVGFAELFEQDHTPEDETFFISEIKENSERLLKLINDILFLSRLDAKMIEFKSTSLDFAPLFDTRCESAWFNLRKPGVSYVVDNPYKQLVVDIDMNNLGMVIDRIAANAAQYTEHGQVRATYDYVVDSLVMTFDDSGCGIPTELQEHIFDRFATGGGSGTGLGLSICHEIVSQMGGRIHIKSEEGKGTIVWVTIPCTCSEIVRK